MSRLKQMRLIKKITQVELARRLGVTCPTVCKFEKQGIFDTRIAQKYAKALECSPIFLLDGLGD